MNTLIKKDGKWIVKEASSGNENNKFYVTDGRATVSWTKSNGVWTSELVSGYNRAFNKMKADSDLVFIASYSPSAICDEMRQYFGGNWKIVKYEA